MKILHLAFEDHQRPGSGGGSVRTREMNRRSRHQVDVVTAGWKGCVDRVEDGVAYTHTKALPGRGSTLPYVLSMPKLARGDYDLVVEDFAAPYSTFGLPRLTSTPVVGMVQWMFAHEKSKQYHLPFGLVEDWGLRAHTNLITVSTDMGREVARRAPHANTYVVENGVSMKPCTNRFSDKPYIAFMGRLDIAQKGLDTLLHAFAAPAVQALGVPLLIGGDGPDELPLKALAERLELGDQVRWVGRVDDQAAFYADASVVAVPSNYETFGMVAAEALSVGTPVVASDIDCLRDVAGPGGLLVPRGDVKALSQALVKMLTNQDLASQLGKHGLEHAARWNWDLLAARQDEVFEEVVARTGVRGAGRK